MRASRKRRSMGESELKKGGQCGHASPSPFLESVFPTGAYPVVLYYYDRTNTILYSVHIRMTTIITPNR